MSIIQIISVIRYILMENAFFSTIYFNNNTIFIKKLFFISRFEIKLVRT